MPLHRYSEIALRDLYTDRRVAEGVSPTAPETAPRDNLISTQSWRVLWGSFVSLLADFQPKRLTEKQGTVPFSHLLIPSRVSSPFLPCVSLGKCPPFSSVLWCSSAFLTVPTLPVYSLRILTLYQPYDPWLFFKWLETVFHMYLDNLGAQQTFTFSPYS